MVRIVCIGVLFFAWCSGGGLAATGAEPGTGSRADYGIHPGVDGADSMIFHAVNQRHGFSIRFEADGLVLGKGVAAAGADCRLSVTGLGRGESLPPCGAPKLVVDRNRIEYR
ncbi:hypothetical protein JW905_15505, partial [bacterium]|nr:hypothetical protein [candidate division CSSED10-310 bacterium]